MLTDLTRLTIRLLMTLVLCGLFTTAKAEMIQGIYLTQGTLENTDYLTYLIEHAKAVGINTFVVDLERPSAKTKANVELLKKNNINYFARIIVFPDGGHPDQIESPAYWAKRYELIKDAIAYGAQQIQLDYIRYSSKEPASPEHAKNIIKVVQWFKSRVEQDHIPLQVDVFGIASFGESKHIGQNLQMMAQNVDALCPMVYPSHYVPYDIHSEKPYQTIYGSLKAIQKQFNDKVPVKLYAYIEMYNFRYPSSGDKRLSYIAAEIKAVKEAGADGWFAWSAHNQYDYLFRLLEAYQKQTPGNILQTVEATPMSSNIYPEKKPATEEADADQPDATPVSSNEDAFNDKMSLVPADIMTAQLAIPQLTKTLEAKHFTY